MQAPDLAPSNVAAGPEAYRSSKRAGAAPAVVLRLRRDHSRTTCRRQVGEVEARVAAFRERDAGAASVLPEPVERARGWQASCDLPRPPPAAPGAEVGEAYGRPVRFGALGAPSDRLGRMPEAVVVDRRPGRERESANAHRGRSTFDRPVDEPPAARDDRPPVDGAGVGADGGVADE